MDLYKFGSFMGLVGGVTGLVAVLLLTHGVYLAGVLVLVMSCSCTSSAVTLVAVSERWLR